MNPITDVKYAIKQLERAKSRQWTGQGCIDELCRALDALERAEEALSILNDSTGPNGEPCLDLDALADVSPRPYGQLHPDQE